MSTEIYGALAVAVTAAAFVQGCAGVGFALITATITALILPRFLPAGLLLLMLPLNAYVDWRERRALDRSGAAWITAGRFVGTLGGVWLLAVVAPAGIQLLVGVATLLAVLATMLSPAFDPRRRALLSAGVITGITEIATGVGGPPLALVYQHRPAPTLRSTIAACFLAGKVTSLVFLASMRQVRTDQLRAAAMLVPALALGSFLSQHVHHRLRGRALRGVVLAFAIVSAIVLLARA